MAYHLLDLTIPQNFLPGITTPWNVTIFGCLSWAIILHSAIKWSCAAIEESRSVFTATSVFSSELLHSALPPLPRANGESQAAMNKKKLHNLYFKNISIIRSIGLFKIKVKFCILYLLRQGLIPMSVILLL